MKKSFFKKKLFLFDCIENIYVCDSLDFSIAPLCTLSLSCSSNQKELKMKEIGRKKMRSM